MPAVDPGLALYLNRRLQNLRSLRFKWSNPFVPESWWNNSLEHARTIVLTYQKPGSPSANNNTAVYGSIPDPLPSTYANANRDALADIIEAADEQLDEDGDDDGATDPQSHDNNEYNILPEHYASSSEQEYGAIALIYQVCR